MNRTSLNSDARGLKQIWGCKCTRESSFVNIGIGATVEYVVGETKRLPGIINNAEHHYSANFYLLGRALMNIMTYSFLFRSIYLCAYPRNVRVDVDVYATSYKSQVYILL